MRFSSVFVSRLALGAIVALGISHQANAQGYAYASDNQNHLYRIDLSNANGTYVGTMAANGALFESLGFDASGQLYGATSGGDLFSVNTSNANTNWIGNTGLGNIEGMDWDATNGRMLVCSFSAPTTIYSLNLGNAVATSVITTNTTSIARTISTRTGSSKMDARFDNSGQGDDHGAIDYVTGGSTTIGSPTTMLLGIDRGSNGALYGVGQTGDLYTINDGTGAVQSVGNVAQTFFVSMAAEPVPEPATIAALGLGAAALLRRRSRR